MVPGRRVLRKCFEFLLILALWGSATSALPVLAAEGEGDKTPADLGENLSSLLQGLASALGLADSEAAEGTAEEQEEAMQQAVEEAQAAYEKEQQELLERLRNDPQWKPSHEQTRVITMGEEAQNRAVNNFCLSKDGNVLVCCGRRSQVESLNLFRPGGVQTPAADRADRGEILVFSPDGK